MFPQVLYMKIWEERVTLFLENNLKIFVQKKTVDLFHFATLKIIIIFKTQHKNVKKQFQVAIY